MSFEAYKVVVRVRLHMKASCAFHTYERPMTLARGLGFTRAEVLLALWLLQRDDLVDRRKDGRWFWKG